MAETAFDFAVIGSTPMAFLLAGLLARAHKKKVALVAESSAAFHLARGIDCSVAPVTRPDMWVAMKAGSKETLKLLARMRARTAVERVDPIFVAESTDGRTALSHIRHMAAAFGYAVERLPEGVPQPGMTAIRIRDCAVLTRAAFEPAAEAWLKSAGVLRFAVRDTAVALQGDGRVKLTAKTGAVEAARVVLADDPAILAHVPELSRDRRFFLDAATVLMTEPVGALPAPLVAYLDREVILNQRKTHGVAALGFGRTDLMLSRVGRYLSSNAHVRRAGQAVFKTLRSRDGAPVIGTGSRTGAFVIADPGPAGAFLAPALARELAGKASAAESAFFAARGFERAAAADYVPRRGLEAVQ